MNETRKAYMSLRVQLLQWMREKRFEELMAILGRNKGLADELAFFSSSIHPVLPLEEVERRMEMLRSRIETARAAGFRAGVNFLNTLGHLDEYLDDALKGDFTRMTDRDGVQAMGSFCSNDDTFKDYIRKAYTAVAKADPDFIWIDDDVRAGHHSPAVYPCFCDNCLRIFNSANGTSYTRESLNLAFDQGTKEEKLALRRKWLDHNSRIIQRLLVQRQDYSAT